jgi:hypothetical protein
MPKYIKTCEPGKNGSGDDAEFVILKETVKYAVEAKYGRIPFIKIGCQVTVLALLVKELPVIVVRATAFALYMVMEGVNDVPPIVK